MLSTQEHYASEAWMGNTTLKGSAITRWQARQNLKSAITTRNLSDLETLLSTHGSGCQAVRINKTGDTLLMLAVREKYLQGLQLLLRYNAANPNLTNQSGSSALDVALLAAACPANHMDEFITLLARITRKVSMNVLTSILDADTEDVDMVANTAALLAKHSKQYEVRAKLLYTLLEYYPDLIKHVIEGHDADPTSLTDPRIDTRRLWTEVISMHYFKQPILQIIPPDLILLLIKAANSPKATEILADLIMKNLEIVCTNPTPGEQQFLSQAITLLANSGFRFNSGELKLMLVGLPDVGQWYEDTFRSAPSLMFLARKSIRNSMKCNVVYGSKQLPLPLTVQTYLRLE